MSDPFGRLIIGSILNFIGGSIRWVYGTIWRTIFNKPKFKFREYIDGPDDSKYFDMAHGFGNIFFEVIFFLIIISILV